MPPRGPDELTRSQAVRFLQRTTFGGTPADVDELVEIGIDAWFDDQRSAPTGPTHLANRIAHSPQVHQSMWGGFLSGPDQFRRRLAYALSQIFVVSRRSLDDHYVCAYADVLEAHCFGTYRDLLEHVTRSPAMGQYLTYSSNRKADPRSGRVPDENYAREVMQLFSIGLWELNQDGTRQQDGSGDPIPSYDTDDILGLARVFTGFGVQPTNDDRTRYALPMLSTGTNAERNHEKGDKHFLGNLVPTSDDRTLDESLAIALDTLANHPNTAPFISHRLIQRLVTSNPSAGYVGRIAAVFANDGDGVRGNLEAVAEAIVLDDEAWETAPPDDFGKLREPVLRLTTVARALGVTSTGTPWQIGSLSDDATALGQQPYEANSVFNFYRPGYVPPQSPLGDGGRVSPEMQLANETTAIGWVNYVARFLKQPPARTYAGGTPDEYRVETRFDIDDLVAMVSSKDVTAATAGALVDEIAARLCPLGLDSRVREIAVRRVVSISSTGYDPTRTDDGHVRFRHDIHLERVVAAVVMIAVSTDFLHER